MKQVYSYFLRSTYSSSIKKAFQCQRRLRVIQIRLCKQTVSCRLHKTNCTNTLACLSLCTLNTSLEMFCHSTTHYAVSIKDGFNPIALRKAKLHTIMAFLSAIELKPVGKVTRDSLLYVSIDWLVVLGLTAL